MNAALGPRFRGDERSKLLLCAPSNESVSLSPLVPAKAGTQGRIYHGLEIALHMHRAGAVLRLRGRLKRRVGGG